MTTKTAKVCTWLLLLMLAGCGCENVIAIGEGMCKSRGGLISIEYYAYVLMPNTLKVQCKDGFKYSGDL